MGANIKVFLYVVDGLLIDCGPQSMAEDVAAFNRTQKIDQVALMWKARGAFLEAIKASTTYMDEVDIVVPRSCVNELVEYTHGLQNELNVHIKSFGHAGDGNLHAYILKDELSDTEWEERLLLAMKKLYAKCRELNGQVSGEHGIGFVKKPYLNESLSPELLKIMRGIKNVFDPNNILNPHKVCQD